MGKERPTTNIIRPGEGLNKTPSKEQVLVFPEVKFDDFLQKIADKGFINFAHYHSKNPGQNVIFAEAIGIVEMVFTDGTISDEFNSVKSFDFFSYYKPKDATYIAHVKKPPVEIDLRTRPLTPAQKLLAEVTDPTQVLIISNRKANEIRKLFKQIEGLQDIHITFNHIRSRF